MEKWSTAEVCNFIASKGFQEDVIELFNVNRISGEVLPLLSDGDLKELGVAALGDRKLLLKCFKTLDLVVENSTRKVSETTKGSTEHHDELHQSNETHFPDENETQGCDSTDNNSDISGDSSYNPVEGMEAETSQYRRQQSCDTLPICDPVPESAVTVEITSQPSHKKLNTHSYKRTLATSTTQLSVPNYLDGWEDSFEIPRHYGSDEIMAQLQMGYITDSVRHRIVQEVARQMMKYCRYPSTRQYDVVAAKLIETYGVLKDCDGTGSMSWSDMLRTRFYNMRRPPKLHAMGLSDSKPPKRQKKDTGSGSHYVRLDLSTSSTDQDNKIFDRNKASIKKITDQKSQTAKILMKETLPLRHQWIKEEFPVVRQILLEFPLLKSYMHLTSELRLLTAMTQDPEIQLAVEWEKWQPRIIKFASINAAGKKLPPTSTTSQLLALTKQNVPADKMAPVALSLLSTIVDKKYAQSENILRKLENGTKISDESMPKTPYIGYTGAESMLNILEYTIIVERQPIVTLEDFRKAIVALIACYYTFNIEYPKEIGNTLLYIEKYLLGINTGKRMKPAATQVISAIEKMAISL